MPVNKYYISIIPAVYDCNSEPCYFVILVLEQHHAHGKSCCSEIMSLRMKSLAFAKEVSSDIYTKMQASRKKTLKYFYSL